MTEEPEYNALPAELEARMRAKREASRRERAVPSNKTPRHFGDYELLELIGEGPAAQVHRARGPSGEEVALKRLRDAVVAGVERPGARAEYLARVEPQLRTLQHPQLLRVLGLARDGAHTALLLELREEETLDALLRRRPALPWREALRIAAKLAGALGALHALGISHDDVKPRNVLIGEDGTVLLMDPSSAREVDAAAGDRAIALAGSPQFMAPERLRGESGSPAGDLYALGALLFQMLSGRVPYKGPLVAQLREQQARGQRAELRSPLGELPAALHELLAAMLAIDPAQRPALNDLQPRLHELAESPERTLRGAGARWKLWIVAGAVLLFLWLLLRTDS